MLAMFLETLLPSSLPPLNFHVDDFYVGAFFLLMPSLEVRHTKAQVYVFFEADLEIGRHKNATLHYEWAV